MNAERRWILITIGIVVVLILLFYGQNKYHDFKVREYQQHINDDTEASIQREQVALAEQFVQQYERAKAKGDLMAMLANATLAANAYHDAGDMHNYERWEDVKEQHERQLRMR